MMWFTNDNPAYIRAVYEIETAKADLIKFKAQLLRAENERAASAAQAELLETNISYLKKYAKIINMREYTRLKHMLASEYEILLLAKNNILSLERVVKASEVSLAYMEARLPSYQSKVLEFRRRG